MVSPCKIGLLPSSAPRPLVRQCPQPQRAHIILPEPQLSSSLPCRSSPIQMPMLSPPLDLLPEKKCSSGRENPRHASLSRVSRGSKDAGYHQRTRRAGDRFSPRWSQAPSGGAGTLTRGKKKHAANTRSSYVTHFHSHRQRYAQGAFQLGRPITAKMGTFFQIPKHFLKTLIFFKILVKFQKITIFW